MVFQSYAVFPHLTVFDNIAFGLKMQGRRGTRSSVASTRRAAAGLSDLLDRYPAQLSGGQRQRVAMGRAIVCKPRCS